MSGPARSGSPVRRAAIFGLVAAVLAFAFIVQFVCEGKDSWGDAMRQEGGFWVVWWIIAVAAFPYFDWLHRGARTRVGVAAGLSLGAIASLVLQPSLLIGFAAAISWAMRSPAPRPGAWLSSWHDTFISLLGVGVTLYGTIFLAWRALTYRAVLQQRQLQAAELQSLLQQAELQTLRSQLNPHFLFNTLHSIAELVHEDPPLAEKLILRLAELLRLALRSSHHQEVSLGEELDFVKSYLEIEQLRLGDRLEVTWDIAPAALPIRVPSLLLHPLVENAIRHGIAPSVGTGRLQVRARLEGDRLELQVRDNGPGLAGNGAAPSEGVGLSNTNKRLQRLYGAGHALEFVNDGGLLVKVCLPANGRLAAGEANHVG